MAARSRTLLLVVAIASGLLAALLAVRYLRQQARPILTGRPVSTGQALVAARDIPVGTVVLEKDVRLVDWPGDAVPQGLLSDPKTVVGRGVLGPMRMNEPFLDAKLAPVGSGGGMPTLIAEGKRAVSVAVDQVSDIAGFMVPGTRVDVLLTMNDPVDQNKEPTTRAILQNLPTLAAGQIMQQDAEGKPMPVSVVTLQVTPEQAETLALASNQGRIQMALRNQLDTTEAKTPGTRQSSLLYGERKPLAPPRRVGVARPRAEAPAQQETIVEGFEGGNRTVRRFSTQP
jgi:pilus assembly protein CpaB